MKKLPILIAILLICCILLPFGAQAAESLIPIGQAVGLQIGDNNVIIAGFDAVLGIPCQRAGLQAGDRIAFIEDTEITCPQDVSRALSAASGAVKILYVRDGKTITASVTPLKTQDGPKLGIYLKQGISGIGTVTWFDPQSGAFGALGHGVNTSKGQLYPLGSGNIYKASVLSVVKGRAGQPGQLIGSLQSKDAIGKIEKNTQQGIFGTANSAWQGSALPIAGKSEIKTGKATILSNISGTEVQEYSVEILKIYPISRGGGRNMLIKVTDPTLLSATGGIVQGMSGSPIIQNGKLVGAVTHVLVNDPTTGYGIFIENMLDAAA